MSDDEKNYDWRTEHLMHRIRAALDETTLLEEVLTTHDADYYDRAQSLRLCADQARHEGHAVALRWLIEFVGINAKDDLTPCRPSGWRTTSEFIDKFGNLNPVPIPGEDAKFLAKIWKACSQATAHPTSGTNHEPLNESNRRKALEIVLRHLETTIYSAAGDTWKKYMKVVSIRPISDGRAEVSFRVS